MCSESNNVFLSTKSSGTDFSIAAIMAKQNNCLKSESTDKDHEITSDSEDNNLENCSSIKSIREISKSPSIDGDDRSTPDPVQVGFLFFFFLFSFWFLDGK